MNTEIQTLLDRPTISVDEAARVLGLGRNSAYEAVRRGEIATKRIGGRIFVLTAPLRRMLDGEAAETPAPLPPPPAHIAA
ncbi:helix-turn-helix domain-containing protein [Bauldia litoralis]|uniref:helix-turn-helix domain-containing protein n=1 Tax=Bauldia litoralis TaxID=665467 RepID=UPI0032643FE7